MVAYAEFARSLNESFFVADGLLKLSSPVLPSRLESIY